MVPPFLTAVNALFGLNPARTMATLHVLVYPVRLPTVDRQHELIAQQFDRFGFGRIELVVLLAAFYSG